MSAAAGLLTLHSLALPFTLVGFSFSPPTDPVSLFSEKLHQNDEEDSDHFENIQSTNWQTMRFKPPPPNSPIGWRVEFR